MGGEAWSGQREDGSETRRRKIAQVCAAFQDSQGLVKQQARMEKLGVSYVEKLPS